VRDISERAGANLAAVNYHFGDKEKLYEGVVCHIINCIKEEFPIDKGFEEATSAEERLLAFVRNLLYRFGDPDRPSWQGALLAEERMNPRPVVLSIMHEEIFKTHSFLNPILNDLLGPNATSDDIELCDASVMGQLLFHAHLRHPHVPEVIKREPMSAEELERLAQHIANFSIAGIRRIQEAREESVRK
jgi:AcrR family transcriptional regulator